MCGSLGHLPATLHLGPLCNHSASTITSRVLRRLTWLLSQCHRARGAWSACQGTLGRGPRQKPTLLSVSSCADCVGMCAVWRVLSKHWLRYRLGHHHPPSEPTAWQMKQTHPQMPSSSAVSVRTEVGTQPCYSGGLLSLCQARAEKGLVCMGETKAIKE